MTRTHLVRFCVLAALCSMLPGALQAQFINVPPVTYRGLVKDYMLKPFDKQYGALVYVRRNASDRTLLAKATTVSPSNGLNYALSIPLVSLSNVVTTAATVGQQVRFEVDDGKLIWGNIPVQTIGIPGSYVLNITLMTDANTNNVADEYEALILALMDAYGIAGAYDPNADYNGDGVTNFQHYLAGTSPFAGKTPGTGDGDGDKLTIASMMQVQVQNTGDFFVLSFRSIPDKMYSVLTLTDLRTSWGAADMVDFRTAPEGDEQTYYTATAAGIVTLYLRKDAASARYYKLRME